MLRGSQKQMIVVRTRDSRLFEEAYFVMRRGKPTRPADKEDMLWEANRIIEGSLPITGTECPSGEPEKGHLRRLGWIRGLYFALGSLCGGGLVGLLWFFL